MWVLFRGTEEKAMHCYAGTCIKGVSKERYPKSNSCSNSKENVSAIQTILNNGGYFLEEFMDDGAHIGTL